MEDANAALKEFGEIFQNHWLTNFRAKLGLQVRRRMILR